MPGSLIALVAYPFAVEPNLSLGAVPPLEDRFLVSAALLMACGLIAHGLRRRSLEAAIPSDDVDASPSARPTRRTILGWLVLVFIPSSWLMGVTTYLTTDLAPIPLLWAIRWASTC